MHHSVRVLTRGCAGRIRRLTPGRERGIVGCARPTTAPTPTPIPTENDRNVEGNEDRNPVTDPGPMTGWLAGVLRRPGRVAAAAAAVAGVVYVGALGNGFAYDDNVLILGDPALRQLSGLWDRLMEPSWPATFGDEIGAWRPVTTGTWALTWIVSDGSPVAFHALGVLLHAAVTGLGVLLLAEMMPVAMAAAAGVLFAVHPVHVEAVANVAGSAELISAVFAMTAALVHVRGGRSYSLARTASVTLLYALAVLAKEGAAVLPLIFFLLDGARRDVPIGRIFEYARERALLFASLSAALILILLFRLDVVGAVAAASHPPGAESLRDAPRVWTVFSTWPHYVRLLFFPADLAADYGPGVIPVVFGWSGAGLLGALLGFASFGGAWAAWRRGAPLTPETGSGRVVGLAVLWIAAALLPVANALFLGPVLVAERTLYLASWGAAAIGGWLAISLVEQRGRKGIWLLVLVSGGAAVGTALRVPAWDDTESVMGALIRDHPESGTGWMHLGRTLAQQGLADDALTAFGYAVVLLDSEYRPSTEIAAHLMAMGRPESAIFFLKRAWREHPEWHTAPGLLAAAQLNAGRPEAAAPAARAAAFLQPSNASMHHLLAQSMAGLGAWEAAVEARRASLRTGFADRGRSWILLAGEQANLGDTAGALASLDSAAIRDLSQAESTTVLELRTAIGVPAEPTRRHP